MRHFDYITRPAKLLTLEIVLFVLFIASSIMFSGCNTKTDAQTEILLNSKETLPINIQIGEKPISLLEGNTIEQTSDADLERNQLPTHANEILLNDEPVKGYTGNLSVNGIEIGTRVADAIDDLKQQNAWVDSEYDPYHDGCTDIFVAYLSDEDTEFTLPDMLDCYIEFAYVKADDDEWSLMEKSETNETINKENAASTKGEPLLKVQYSIFVPEDGDIVKDGVIAGVLVSIDNHTHIV